jgi:hypothetical protein
MYPIIASTVFIEVAELVKKYLDFIESEGSSQCWQKIATDSKMNQSTYAHHNICL